MSAEQHRDPLNIEIRSSITAGSLQRHFGLPGAADYRTHPNQRDAELPVSIFNGMREKEVGPLQDLKVLKGTIYSLKNRRIITRWLRDVAAAFKLRTTTLCLGTQLTDCFLIKSLQTLPVSQCQLAAIASLWIAAKFEEMDEALPSTRALVDVCASAYTREQVLDMEEAVLEAFKWKIPHVTVMNFLFFFLHAHTDAALVASLRAQRDAGATPQPPVSSRTKGSSAPPAVEVVMLVVNPATKARASVKVLIPHGAPLATSLPTICTAVGIPVSPNMELYELLGADLLISRRLILSSTPAEHRLPNGAQLFLSTSGAAAVFAEREEYSILRTMNGLLLHVCETLVQESVVNVEFLRFASHTTALAVLAVARCLTGRHPEEVRESLAFLKGSLKVSLSTTYAAAQILVEKYKEALEGSPEVMPPPLIAVPPDVNERLAFVFGKAAGSSKCGSAASPKE